MRGKQLWSGSRLEDGILLTAKYEHSPFHTFYLAYQMDPERTILDTGVFCNKI
jgi:hypothetical protein